MDGLHATDPRQVGRYSLLGRLGSGGMGQVFLGRSPGGRYVAVKLIRAELAQDADFRTRFAREVAAARRVSGIFTAPVVDADANCDRPWLVTAYVPGPSLADLVQDQGPMPARSVLDLAGGVAEGLAAIHAAGVVHRDLKPSNILLAPDGPRIIDFGISRPADATSLTRTGSIVGSPGFMSPEQVEGYPIGPASDIFSLASSVTFAASGEGPFGDAAPTVLLYRIVHEMPCTDRLPWQLRSLIERSLAKDPSRRPTAEMFLSALPPAAALEGATENPDPIGQATMTAAASDGGAAAEAKTPVVAVGPEPATAQGGGPGSGREHKRSTPWALAGALLALVAALGALLVALRLHDSAPSAASAARTVTASPTHASASPAGRSASPASTKASPASTSASPASTRASPAVSSAAPAVPGPAATVQSYIAAINQRNWPRAWNLGGDNLGGSYSTFVAGFSQTSHDVITGLHASGDTVTLTMQAYETTGAVQTYALRYVVHGGVIVAGHGTLLGTSP
jgi:eukaryotic-like serine/threonine-protein kinase